MQVVILYSKNVYCVNTNEGLLHNDSQEFDELPFLFPSPWNLKGTRVHSVSFVCQITGPGMPESDSFTVNVNSMPGSHHSMQPDC
jgi:hypothetical protein